MSKQKVTSIEINQAKIKLQLWDTAGQERFQTITTSYYRGAHGILVVYDVTNKLTFKNVKTWLSDIDRFTSSTVVKGLVGNKMDVDTLPPENKMKREVTFDEGKQFADSLNIPFFETSAKDGRNVDETFEALCQLVYFQFQKT
eukprot:TRINITY_DN971_c0_g1_i1.p2 TRINITY_DN971_c0_g1~~TRINITY_DN971_c0_g1_i1.p2  ORF type:complete len:143 (+),score=38.29 TRINITY_DN971_c0_g1_i1:261-689(+)